MNSRAPLFLHELNRALAECLAADPDVIILGEDIVDPYGGAFKVTKGLSTAFPGRVIATPISESCIVGIGVGMAMRGMKPVVEIMFGDFVTIAADQLINHAAKFREMYNDQVKVPLVVRTPMGGGRGYGPTHSQCLEKIFLGIPGLNVVAPSLFHEVGDLLGRAIIEEQDPILFVEHKMLYPLPLQRSDDLITVVTVADELGFPVAEVKNYSTGDPDVTILTYGGTSRHIAPLMQAMADEEIRVCAWLPSLISGVLPSAVLDSIKRSGRAIVVEEGSGGFGWGAEMAAYIAEKAGRYLHKPVVRIAAAATAIPAARDLESLVLPQYENIEKAIEEVLS